jgi:uncharacterized BrkB/YihY/UPF0761 family membrane protein
MVSLLLAAYAAKSTEFGATYGPLTGIMALLLWANLTGIALFLGVAFTTQLEAARAEGPEPARASGSRCSRSGPIPHLPAA